MCADEEPYQVKAYARDGIARRPSSGGGGGTGGIPGDGRKDGPHRRADTAAEAGWRERSGANADYAMGLTGRSARAASWKVRWSGATSVGAQGPETRLQASLGTDETGTSDWITFVEPEDRTEELRSLPSTSGRSSSVTARDLESAEPPGRVRSGAGDSERIERTDVRAAGPAGPDSGKALGHEPSRAEDAGVGSRSLNPAQEGGLFSTLGRGWKYRKCIEERKAAKRFLGPFTRESSKQGGEA